MWKDVPHKLHLLLDHYTGEEGYNGREYSYEWLLGFLKEKGVNKELKDLTSKYGAEPLWFDRAAYAKIIEAETAGS